ncbi:MAG: cellulase family glycosylhydrolase [Armatimonadetes bacterium]|nr:cellulase family glycosylhydrolase [Armatimonadota bacterium]
MIGFSLALAMTAAPLPIISTDGLTLVDSNHKKVVLRGVNLGGWLVEEIWMTPWVNKASETAPETVKDHVSLWKTVAEHTSDADSLRVREAWRDNWITPYDFKKIKEAGLNHIRLPFLESLLDEKGGMDRLKWAVNQARENGLYVVLDMHGAPGSQNNEHHSGQEGRNRLWFDVENIATMEKKWKLLAKEFKDDSTVAVYDIMNEPMGAPNPAMLHIVYDRVIRAIRTVDAKKVVLVDDGYKGFETTPHPNLAGWTNVGFSLHFYNFDAKQTGDHVKGLQDRIPKVKELQGYRNAPMYIGEFQLEPQWSAAGLHEFTTLMTKQDWSWALWSWKACGAGGTVGNWGVYRPKSFEPVNPFKDSADTMITKIKAFRSENWFAPNDLLDALKP